MSEALFDELQTLAQTNGPAAALDRLIESQREAKQYHRLFDAILMKRKFEMGLPIARPTVFDDVPEERKREFEEHYVNAAREVGQMLLDDGNIPQAWIYFKTIQEPEPVKAAIEKLGMELKDAPNYDEILQVALYDGAHPVFGIRLMLETHGTCNTITSLDQMMGHLKPEARTEGAAVLVDHLYEELRGSLEYCVKEKLPTLEPNQSVKQLMATREEVLFGAGNYHIDVSHLNAVVRFARSLEKDAPQLQKAIELAEYGSHLDKSLQYGGDPPFQDFYPAHLQYFHVLSGKDIDGGLKYFYNELEREPDFPDKQLISYVMVDLLTRIDRLEEAVSLAREYLPELEDPNGFSFGALCLKAGKLDVLRDAARHYRDPLRFTVGLISESVSG